MIVYAVSGGADPTQYYATQREALAVARATSKDDRDELTIGVERCVLVPLDKFNVLRMLNQLGGYVADATMIAEFKNGRRLPSSSPRENEE